MTASVACPSDVNVLAPLLCCSVCSKKFSSKTYLRKHSAKCTKPGDLVALRFPCEFCQKVFPFLSHLQRHLLSHAELRPHRCAECGQSFAQKAHLLRHAGIHRELQGDDTRRAYRCDEAPSCSASFTTGWELRRHVRRVHLSKRDVSCPTCREVFEDRKAYDKHVEEHKGIRRFKCDICSQAFKQRCELKNHLATHSNGRFECVCCRTVFRQRVQFDRHWAKMHGVDSVESHFNGSLLFRSSITCFVCAESQDEDDRECLKTKQDLIRHLSAEHGCKTIYTCKYCSAVLTSQQLRMEHTRNYHFQEIEQKVSSRPRVVSRPNVAICLDKAETSFADNKHVFTPPCSSSARSDFASCESVSDGQQPVLLTKGARKRFAVNDDALPKPKRANRTTAKAKLRNSSLSTSASQKPNVPPLTAIKLKIVFGPRFLPRASVDVSSYLPANLLLISALQQLRIKSTNGNFQTGQELLVMLNLGSETITLQNAMSCDRATIIDVHSNLYCPLNSSQSIEISHYSSSSHDLMDLSSLLSVRARDDSSKMSCRTSGGRVVRDDENDFPFAALSHISDAPPLQQIALGSVSGCVCGYTLTKISKWTAIAIGGAMITLQCLSYQGYITINWPMIKDRVRKTAHSVERRLTDEESVRSLLRKTEDFVKKNRYFAGSFAAGCLVGLGYG